MRGRAKLGYALGAAMVVVLEMVAFAGWRQPAQVARQAREQSAAPAPHVRGRIDVQPLPALDALPGRPEDALYAQLRRRVRWIETRIDGQVLLTPDMPSRMLLAMSAAREAGLHEVGLGFQDVYGIINAETSWVPRTGASRDGTPNLGIAQFEPETAAALGVRDPHDAVEAVHAAARLMKHAALWSRSRIAGLKLSRQDYSERLREGVSIYYNLSSRGRAAWNGRNAHELPPETNHHIRNARLGAREAMQLEAQLRPVLTASLAAGAGSE